MDDPEMNLPARPAEQTLGPAEKLVRRTWFRSPARTTRMQKGDEKVLTRNEYPWMLLWRNS